MDKIVNIKNWGVGGKNGRVPSTFLFVPLSPFSCWAYRAYICLKAETNHILKPKKLGELNFIPSHLDSNPTCYHFLHKLSKIIL